MVSKLVYTIYIVLAITEGYDAGSQSRRHMGFETRVEPEHFYSPPPRGSLAT